jgi:hypothetical protein
LLMSPALAPTTGVVVMVVVGVAVMAEVATVAAGVVDPGEGDSAGIKLSTR